MECILVLFVCPGAVSAASVGSERLRRGLTLFPLRTAGEKPKIIIKTISDDIFFFFCLLSGTTPFDRASKRPTQHVCGAGRCHPRDPFARDASGVYTRTYEYLICVATIIHTHM